MNSISWLVGLLLCTGIGIVVSGLMSYLNSDAAILLIALIFIILGAIYFFGNEEPEKELSADEASYLNGFYDGKNSLSKRGNKEAYLDGYSDGEKYKNAENN